MSWNLFIDDERVPRDVTWAIPEVRAMYFNEPWEIARNIAEVELFILYLGYPKFISFDHDLGDSAHSGFDIAKFLVECDMDQRKGFTIPANFDYYVHSMNPIGRKNIVDYLDQYLDMK